MKTYYTQNRNNGGWQGYVGVPLGHPLHGKSYSDTLPLHVDQSILHTEEELMDNKGIIQTFLAMLGDEELSKSISYQFNVHGGITYSGYGYWNTKKIEPPNHEKTKKLIKAYHIYDLTGNDLFTHYYKKEYSIAKERVKKIYESVKRLIGYLELEVLQPNQYAGKMSDGEIRFMQYVEDDWYFGWDSGHYGDDAESCNYDYAVKQTEYLKKQIEDWTLLYYNTI